jgi:hypothetical protein
MGLVAVTIGLFSLGAYLARNLSSGLAMAFWIASFVCLLAMNVTVRQSEQLTLGFLFGFGLLVGWPRHRRSPTTPTSIPSRSGRPAGRRRCLSPASVLAATRRDETSPHWLECCAGR